MDISQKKNPNLIEPINFPGMGRTEMEGRKIGQEISQKRRALSVINQNLVGTQAYPCVVNKRALLSGKHVICEKKQADPFHRPITRQFAAQIANNQKPVPQEPNKSNCKGFGESIFIDEECKSPEDHLDPEPMFLEEDTETETMQEEPSQMEEVEMEDLVEEPVEDIDSKDVKNPLAVVDYIDDLYAYYRKMESLSCVSSNYMENQFDINEKMRAILIDWLIEVHDKFDLMSETLFLSVNLIDRFLEKQSVVRKKLQLVGLVAMLLACKYEEVSVPVVGDLILISDKAYTRTEVIEMETLMLNTLQFNMSVPTPYVFIRRFLKASQSDKKIEVLAFFLVELSLVEYEMVKYAPSLVAAAAIYTAHCTLYGIKRWNKTCEWHSTYSEDQLLECSRLIVGYHQKAATGRLTGVHRKYSTTKFGHTAKCEPASFLLETQ